MRRATWLEQGVRATTATAAAAAIVLGCRGQVERLFVDDGPDTGDASMDDAAAADDERATTPDATPAPDAGTDGDADAQAEAGISHTVGGSVLGLTGSGMVLQLNGGSNLPITAAAGADVPFTFGAAVLEGSSFAVTIQTQPSAPAQACAVGGGTGVMSTANVTGVIVNCNANLFTIGGTISGLEGSVTLRNEGGNDLPLTANGGFAFSTPLATGAPYDVTVSSHSALPVQSCAVTNGSGNVSGGNVNSVGVACTSTKFMVSGTASGLTGTVVIKNGAEVLPVLASGGFSFTQGVFSNRGYDVQVVSSPAGTTCVVANGQGTITNANITNVTLTCFPQYALNESFDGVVAPSLPPTWVTTILQKTGSPAAFETKTTASASGSLPTNESLPNSGGVGDHGNISDIVFVSPSFTVSSSAATLTFRQAFALEASATAASTTGYDGGVLEISIEGGAWTDIATAGGVWVTGGYNKFLYDNWYNPLGTVSILVGSGGRPCWSGSSGGWMTTTVKLPLTVGQSAKIRFREGTDNKNTVCAGPPYCEGWRVDSVMVAN